MRRAATMALALLMSIGFLGPRPAAAEPPPGETPAGSAKRAQELFNEGFALLNQARWAEAEVKLLAAFELNPTYDIAGNLGQVQVRLQKFPEAAKHLDFAIRNWPVIGNQAPKALAETRLKEMRTLVTTVRVRVNVPGAAVLIDGNNVGTSPIEHDLFVAPGTRTIEATLPGHDTAKQVVEGKKGESIAVELSPTLIRTAEAPSTHGALAPPPAAGAAGNAEGPNKAVLTFGAITTGVAAVAGVVFVFVANSKGSDAEAKRDALIRESGAGACSRASVPAGCAAVDDAFAENRYYTNGAFWSFAGAGAVGIGTLIYGLVTRPSKPEEGARVTALVGPSHAGISVRGAF